MIQQRNVALCIVFSVITCGLYSLWWMVCLTDDTNIVSGNENDTSGVVVLLLSIITCGIYSWYWLYKKGNQIDEAKNSRGIPSSNTGIIYLVLGLFGLSIISYALMQNDLNQLAE